MALVFNPGELMTRTMGRIGAPERTQVTQRRDKRTKRILLVEDSGITRAMVARVLTAFGYVVSEAEDGVEALKLLSANPVDLILTDLEMPNMDGIQLIERVRAKSDWRHLPILVHSTRGSDQDKKRAIAAGADAYLIKSDFSEAVLKEMITSKLGL